MIGFDGKYNKLFYVVKFFLKENMMFLLGGPLSFFYTFV